MSFSTIIVDSHNLFREGLERLIKDNSAINVIGSVDSGKKCIELLHREDVDLVITDIQISDISYQELINQIRNIDSNCKIIVLSESTIPTDISNIYDLDVDAYILKNISYYEFISIINNVLIGNKYFDPNVLPILNKELLSRNIQDDLLNRLTRRERQLLICVAKGMSNKEIALDCNISERTVKNHLSSIFQKIEVSDRTQAAVFAIKTNLVEV